MEHQRAERPDAKRGQPLKDTNLDSFRLTSTAAFFLFAAVNLLAAITAPIQDCDEVFNYWEPTHYLNHGFGLQTWEYSPEYAIRSWLYILLHSLPGKIVSPLLPQKSSEFYLVRLLLGAVCTACETRLYLVISRFVNSRVAVYYLIAMASSSGMYYASVAYLPSSFAMYAVMLGIAQFMNQTGSRNFSWGVFSFVVGATVGWPFSAALITPLLFDSLVRACINHEIRIFLQSIFDSLVATSALVAIQVGVDSFFYRKFVFVPWRIVSYNVFGGSSRGPDIFGTESWHFYVRNLLLNFNLWFILALCAGPLLIIMLAWSSVNCHRLVWQLPYWRILVFACPFYMWLAIFSVQEHKEERFMYPAYPFLCFNAAVALHLILFGVGQMGQNATISRILPARLRLIISLSVVLGAVALGILRTAATVNAYRAPLEVYRPRQRNESYAHEETSLCIGKEWYRFPSSYFLPNNVRARFIKSAFDGLLPGQFSESPKESRFPPTWIVPPGMNDQNLEDPNKNVDIAQCSFLVDSYFPRSEPSRLEPDYILDTKTWEALRCHKFLDASQTHYLGRLLWIPDWKIIPARYRRKWGQYCLLRRKNMLD